MFRINSIFIFLMLFLCVAIKAQQKEEKERFLEVRGISEMDMEPLGGATANLYEGTTLIKSEKTNSDGTFSFRLEMNKKYLIVVEKDGLISKRISFNTTLPDDEKGTWMNEFSVGLLRPCNGVDYSVLQQPVDEITFDSKRREFISDKNYVSTMRPRIMNLMEKSDNCLIQTYESAIKKADQLAAQKNYQEAANVYREALKIMPKEEYAAKKITEMNALINRQQFSADAYQKVIAEADALNAQGKYNEALQKYKQASSLNPQESYPKQKAAELESTLSQQMAAKQAQMSKEERYNQALAKASVAFTRKDYVTAKQFYQEALQVKPDESLPKTRIQEADAFLAKKAADEAARTAEIAQKTASEKEYQSLIAQADALFKEKKFEEAKAVYTKALNLKPSESYPAQRIKTVDNATASQMASLQKEKEEGYNNAMDAANNAIAKNQFELAKQNLQKALTFKADDLAAKSKIAEVDRLAEDFKKRKSLEEQYASVIQSADAMLSAKDYQKAKESYVQALTLKPGDKYAQTKITAIENTIAAEQAAQLKVQTETYNTAIASGNNALAKNQFSIAKESFQKALTIKPEDAQAKSKLAETARLEEQFMKDQAAGEKYSSAMQSGDSYFLSKDYTRARENYVLALSHKPGDKNAQAKITNVDNTVAAEQAAILKSQNDNYAAAFAAGNNALAKNQFELAKESFQKALSIKPNDQAAKLKIEETARLADTYAKQQVLDEQYRKIIQSADAFLGTKDLTKARENYVQALSLKPGDSYSQSRITAIDNAIAAEQAAKLKATEEGYQSAIGAANTAIMQKAYSQAKEFLQKALSIKPGDQYVMTKTAEVDRLIVEQQKQVEREKELERQYKETIAVADKLFSSQDYTSARTSFNKALQYKPGDAYANQKIVSIESILATELANKQKKIEEDFKNAMDKGSSALVTKQFQSAKEAFLLALSIKPADNNAKSKLSEAEMLLKQEQERILAEQNKKKKYDELVKAGDQFFTVKNYTNAKNAYELALTTMPSETYPRQKIEEANRAIAELERIDAENKAKENAYRMALINGEKSLNAKDYLQAKDEYSRASVLMPNENLPKSKIIEIENLIKAQEKAQADAKARTDAYTAAINAGNASFTKKDYIAARTSYSEALKFMPGDLLATDQIKKIDYLAAEAEKVRKAEEERKASYNALIASADKLFDEGKYPMAKEDYKKSLAIDPSSTYAKQKIARIDEIIRMLAQNPAKTQTTATTAAVSKPKNIAAIEMRDLNFKTESERQKYLDELKSKYPQGITLEKYIEQYKDTYRYIIIRNDVAQEFRQIKYKTYSGAQYSVNGKPITQQYFLLQIKQRDGESFKEIEM